MITSHFGTDQRKNSVSYQRWWIEKKTIIQAIQPILKAFPKKINNKFMQKGRIDTQTAAIWSAWIAKMTWLTKLETRILLKSTKVVLNLENWSKDSIPTVYKMIPTRIIIVTNFQTTFKEDPEEKSEAIGNLINSKFSPPKNTELQNVIKIFFKRNF